MRLGKKQVLKILAVGCYLVAVGQLFELCQTYRMHQAFLSEGQKTTAYLGLKSQNWANTKELYWEVSYWVFILRTAWLTENWRIKKGKLFLK